jgi:hypothetical protein
MDAESVQEYVTSAKTAINESPQMGEATTKAAILSDFIELLGWEVPINTELEYSVKALGRTFKVDYALVLDGRPVAFVEAKGLDTPLSREHREQLSEYLRSEDVNWGILANGEEYEFYQRRIIDSEVRIEAVEKTTLEKLPQKINILEAYQAETIRAEESGPIIEHIRKLRESRETLNEDKEELAVSVAELLTESVSDVIESDAKTQAKEMIDRLVADVDQQISPAATDSDDETLPPSEPSGEPPETPDSYRATLARNRGIEEQFENTVQSDLMIAVVDYLIQTHNLVSAVEPLPYIPGKKRAIINDEPTYNGSEMAQPREVGEGYYVEVNLSWPQKKREMERMADACGVDITVESSTEN